MALLRRAGSPSPNTSGRLRLSRVSIPRTSEPTEGATRFLLAYWFIGALLCLCGDDMVGDSNSEIETIENHCFNFGVSARTARRASTARCSSVICGCLTTANGIERRFQREPQAPLGTKI